MSESTEMYLVKIALMESAGDPVPLPQLADVLGISPVSTNQMCRKLDDKGLVEYFPYRGVTLTSSGWAAANRVIRRRRLWEVFLVERLGFGLKHAEEAACAFEHVTPDSVADGLAEYMGNPAACPHGNPIPAVGSPEKPQALTSLRMLRAGENGRVADLELDDAERGFLRGQGIGLGLDLRVLAVGEDGTVLVETEAGRLSVSNEISGRIDVVVCPAAGDARMSSGAASTRKVGPVSD